MEREIIITKKKKRIPSKKQKLIKLGNTADRNSWIANLKRKNEVNEALMRIQKAAKIALNQPVPSHSKRSPPLLLDKQRTPSPKISANNSSNADSKGALYFKETLSLPSIVTKEKPIKLIQKLIHNSTSSVAGTSDSVQSSNTSDKKVQPPMNRRGVETLGHMTFAKDEKSSFRNLKFVKNDANSTSPQTSVIYQGVGNRRGVYNYTPEVRFEKKGIISKDRGTYGPRSPNFNKKTLVPKYDKNKDALVKYTRDVPINAYPIHSVLKNHPKKKGSIANVLAMQENYNGRYCIDCLNNIIKSLNSAPAPINKGKHMQSITLKRTNKERTPIYISDIQYRTDEMNKKTKNEEIIRPGYNREDKKGVKMKNKVTKKRMVRPDENEYRCLNHSIKQPEIINLLPSTSGKKSRPSKSVRQHKQSTKNDVENTNEVKTYTMQEVARSVNRSSIADEEYRDYVTKPRSQGKNSPIIFDACNSKNKTEINCKMCKECPMRQLISKIDPVVGNDRMSYPVIAFTCCRKAPRMKEIGTSTFEF